MKAQSRSTTGKNQQQRRKGRPSFLQVLFSPVVLLGNSFHAKQKRNPQLLCAFFILTTGLLGLTGLGLWLALEPSPLAATLVKFLTVANQPSIPVPNELTAIIDANAVRNNLDPKLVAAIIHNESRFQPHAISPAGARGMMQLMPVVWRQYSDSTCSGEHAPGQLCDAVRCIYDPKANIRVGTAYFRELLDHYHGRVALAIEAYNAGMANVQPGAAPKYAETRGYLRNLLRDWHQRNRTELIGQLQGAKLLWNGLKLFWVTVFGSWLIFLWWVRLKQ